MLSRSVLLIAATENGSIPGLKHGDISYEFNFNPFDPAIYVEVLIKKSKNSNQNRVNKDYLLKRLHALCSNKSQSKEDQ